MPETPTLQIFYGISSPWAYFGAERAYAIARKHGARVELRPIRIIEANGGIPLRTRLQPRQDYHAVELARWRDYLGIPLNLAPRFYPCRTIELAAKDARRRLRQVTFKTQASDHPIIAGWENTNYLKFLIVQVL